MPISWKREWPLILAACEAKEGVDPFFVAAIRKAENGRPGREYGVLSIPAPTYADQLRICVNSVRNRLREQGLDPRVSRPYSRDFIAVFARRWAPRGASNDPTNLNNHWFTNVSIAYAKFTENGKPS